jgi:hypothetical protein
MEWIVGAYAVIGTWKALVALGGDDPTEKPLWMTAEKNALVWSLWFVAYVILWPIAARRAAK